MQIFEQPDPDADVVAIDTALFQSASSFFRRPNDFADPEALACFAAVATPFCNGAGLVVPLLTSSARGNSEPALMEWWPGRVRYVGALDAVGEIKSTLYDAFVTAVEAAPEKVAEWLRFQFAADLIDQNFTDAEREDYHRYLPVAVELIGRGKLPTFTREIRKLVPPSVVNLHRHRAWDAKDHIQLAVGFALSFFIRGWLYGFALDRHPLQPRYRHLWFREEAFAVNPVNSVERALDHRHAWYPWGEILAMLLGDDPDPGKVRDALLGLREQAADFRLAFEDASAVDRTRTVSGDTLTAREELALDALARLKVFPGMRERDRLTGILALWRQIAGLLAGADTKTTVLVELISIMLPSGWTNSVVAATTKTFFRDSYWKMYRATNLRQLLRWSSRDFDPA